MPKSTPEAVEPDQFGRLRIRDEDTGHEYSIPAGGVGHGNYTVLDEPASNAGGDELPPKHAAPKSLSKQQNPNSGQQAETVKENDHA